MVQTYCAATCCQEEVTLFAWAGVTGTNTHTDMPPTPGTESQKHKEALRASGKVFNAVSSDDGLLTQRVFA